MNQYGANHIIATDETLLVFEDGLFSNFKTLKTVDLHVAHRSSGTSMDNWFGGCCKLPFPDDFFLGTAVNGMTMDTSKVTNMCNMFGNNKNLKTVNLGNLTFASCTNYTDMFFNLPKLTTIYAYKQDADLSL